MSVESRYADVVRRASPTVYWTDRSQAPPPAPALRSHATVDLAIIGGGYTGLWAALQALEESPGRRVAVFEAAECGFGASSRNGGFCAASLTHGLEHGVDMWPDDSEELIRLGIENLEGYEQDLVRHGINADFERTGAVDFATEPWQVEELDEEAETFQEYGQPAKVIDAAQSRAILNSPTFLGGIVRPELTALVDPAKVVWGLRAAIERLGGVVYDHTSVQSVRREGGRSANSGPLVLTTPMARVLADRVIVATNAYPAPIKAPKWFMIPVYDHVLMTEPLSREQMDAIGWSGREGAGDSANQFHYYRLTADNRILWGGYHATYHYKNGVDPSFDVQDETHQVLAEHFFETFPQLEGLGFSHRWGGPIATTSQFTATWGRSFNGRLSWVVGYTGLGVGASRFGARTALDLVDGKSTERTTLEMVRRKPVPFPPEPLRSAVVGITKRSIQKADENDGRRGLWLKTLDRFGIGFDS